MDIGWIGIGNMGKPMAKNIQTYATKFTVTDLNQESAIDILESGGNSLAFPYGPIMLIFHLPTTLIGWIIDSIFSYEYFTNFGFRLSLLLADL